MSQSWRSCPLWMHTRQLCLDPCAGSMCFSVPLGLGRLQTPTVALAFQAYSPGTLLCLYLLLPPLSALFLGPLVYHRDYKGFFYTGHRQLVDLTAEIQSRRNVCTQFSSTWALEHFLGFGWCHSSPGSPLLYPGTPAEPSLPKL